MSEACPPLKQMLLHERTRFAFDHCWSIWVQVGKYVGHYLRMWGMVYTPIYVPNTWNKSPRQHHVIPYPSIEML